ncbi:metal transporter Nramp5-like isoform X1 [Coffea eugenioides]|uniref:metal transporter Nramp5-like isoform X1 n=2 Tax=Coffea eugenioides TaxID=49369 RepID=UPI000F60A99C|nr:metal transporter Nramp5-like isoform X1 [Coffea eugenioides]
MAALVQIKETSSPWKKLLGYIGPGILVSVAYLDPGNLETDLQAGADHKYELLWIVFAGLLFALLIQSRSANLGVATGKHLSEHCKKEYPKSVNICLWMLAEIAVIAADIPEVIGTAFALNILFRIPIWSGVLLAGLNTLVLLGLQRYGIRLLEGVISILLLVLGGCFFSVMVHARPSVKEIAMGLVVPRLSGGSATRDAVALLGALIMPHNLFLHSALVISRKITRSPDGIRSASRCFLLESSLALLFAFLINVAVIAVSGSVCSYPNISSESKKQCKNITLDSAAFLLKDALGKWSSKLYAISLLASGQSSTVTGTYAGQYIMQGFLDLRMKLWLRNLLTRCIAIAPSLVVCSVGGSAGAGRLIIIASMILSFELPFALIPLLKFTGSAAKMGLHKNSIVVSLCTWLLGLCSIAINIYFLSTSLLGWITNKKMPKAASILSGLLIFPLITLYIALLAYLILKPETASQGSTDFDTDSNHHDEAEVEPRAEFNHTQRTGEIEIDSITCS